MNAIVYTSSAGTTAQYAEMIGAKTGLPVYSLEEAEGTLPQGSEILYLGWLMAGKVKGYKKAAKSYHVLAVCGVGMARGGAQDADVRKRNQVPDAVPVFTLQGGFHMEKTHGIYKLMMKMMCSTVGKKLKNQPVRTEEEEEMLEMMEVGADYVNEKNLLDVYNWLELE